MERLKLATIWLGGCSGCHMSFLDMDEFLLELGEKADLVYSPFVDTKQFPEHVDVTLVEGAVCNEDHLATIRNVRERSRILLALGDCAVTGNVSAIRNAIGNAQAVLKRSYPERSEPPGPIPTEEGIVPVLLDRVVPVHEVVHVDAFLPGCPPSGPVIRNAIETLLAGQPLEVAKQGPTFGGYHARSS